MVGCGTSPRDGVMTQSRAPFRPLIRFGTRTPDPSGWRAAGLGFDRPGTLLERDEALRQANHRMTWAGGNLVWVALFLAVFTTHFVHQHQMPFADTPGFRYAFFLMYAYLIGTNLFFLRKGFLQRQALWLVPPPLTAVARPSASVTEALAFLNDSPVPLMAGDLQRLDRLNRSA